MGRGGFRIIAGLLALAGVATLMAVAYGAGYSDGSVAGTRDIPGWVFGGAFVGWHIVGLLVGLLVFVLVIRLLLAAVFGHRHGPWGYRYGTVPGPDDPSGLHGSWHGGWRSRASDARQAWLEDWHRHAHGDETGASGGNAGPGSGAVA